MSIADCYSGLDLQRRQKIVSLHAVAVIGANVARLDDAVGADQEGRRNRQHPRLIALEWGDIKAACKYTPTVSGLIPTGLGGVGRAGASKHGAIDSEAIRHFKFVAASSILGVSVQTECAKI